MRVALPVLALLLVSAPAVADVLHPPGGAAVPSPMGCGGNAPTGLAAVLACECDAGTGCNIGAPCPLPGPCPMPTGSCETTLWHEPNDNTCIPTHLAGLDPYRDGSLTPETFEPTCPLTFRLVTRGTARFHDLFGWYNVTGAAPAAADLYPMLDCSTTAGAEVSLDVRSDPRWAGGEIGFFIATPERHDAGGQCAGDDCCARVERLSDSVGRVFYSQRAFNPDAAGADSFIHLVVYDSVRAERTFYFAWEDIFGGSNNDFTDIVTSVGGVECSGGGSACDTGEPGLCAYGVTACRGSAVECVQVYDAAEETCNGSDDDCDGEIDEDGVCSDDVGSASCAGITCANGEICRNGECTDPCNDVQCPTGQACLSGICLAGCNQCNGVVCADDATCDLGSGSCLGPDDEGGGPDAGPGGAGDGGTPGTSGCCDTRRGGGAGSLALALLTALSMRRRRARPCRMGSR
jgi:hypothetical protein